MTTNTTDSTPGQTGGQQALPAQLDERVAAIRQQWADLREGWNPATLVNIHSGLSELAEFAGHEGFPSLADAAFSAEVYLSSYVGTEIPMTSEQRETVDSLLAGLTAEHAQQGGTDVESFPPASPDDIYLVGTSDGALHEFAESLRVLGQKLQIHETAAETHEALQRALPTLIVADIKVISDLEPVLEELAHIHKTTGQRIPVAYVSERDELAARIKAVRAEGEAFFCPPYDTNEIGLKLTDLRNQDSNVGRRVLVVEDDPSQAEFAASIIEKTGIQTATITDPMQVVDKLREFRPDLILMDIYMPEVNGIELTRVIREYNEFADIPIVFLSGEQDTDRQVDALSVGGDDFITKPIRPKQLIAIIENRIRRSCLLRQSEAASPLRNLLTRKQFVDRVTNLLSTDPMHVQSSSIISLAPDHSERLKEQLGNENFEQLIIELAQTVEEQLEEKDAIAQIDDGMLGVVVRRRDSNAVQDLASRLHEAISSHNFSVAGGSQSITAGIGLSFANRDENDANDLLSRARTALARALETSPGHTTVYEQGAEQQLPQETGPEHETQDIASHIGRCLQENAFIALFQPMLDLQARGSETYAIQLRMPTPKGELLPLAEFRKDAEKHNLAEAVDKWALEHALDKLKKRGVSQSEIRLFICQSGSSILNPEYPDWIAEQLRSHRMVGTGLVLDFPLSNLSHDLKAAKQHISMLRKMDIRICLSQFPEKPAAFKLLRYVRGNYIRIAKRLLKTDKQTIQSIINQAHQAKAQVIISHIDDPRAIDLHWSSGADLLQGDFIQPPMEEMDYDFAQVVI